VKIASFKELLLLKEKAHNSIILTVDSPQELPGVVIMAVNFLRALDGGVRIFFTFAMTKKGVEELYQQSLRIFFSFEAPSLYTAELDTIVSKENCDLVFGKIYLGSKGSRPD
jgi:hypothetical protein